MRKSIPTLRTDLVARMLREDRPAPKRDDADVLSTTPMQLETARRLLAAAKPDSKAPRPRPN